MKEKILKTLKEKIFAYDPVHEWNIPSIAGFEQAAEEITKLFPGWISVSERLPEKPKYGEEVKIYPVAINAGNGTIHYIYADYDHLGDWNTYPNEWKLNSESIIAWFDVPELPNLTGGEIYSKEADNA